MATTDIDIASRALVIIGSAPISSFADEGDEAVAANILYPMAVETLFGRYKWRFSTAMTQLSRLASAPDHKFDAAYQKPSDLVALHGVYVNDQPIDYDIYEDRIMCDATSSDAVYADYTFKPSESKWPAYFRTALIYELAAGLAMSVAGDPDMGKALSERARNEYLMATHQDSANQRNRKISTNRFINIRGSNRR